MKKFTLGLVMLGAFGVAGFAQTSQASEMYRLYNPNSSEHFYSSNAVEKDILTNAGWYDEGIGWQAPDSGTDVYRLYNPNAGDHHYTTNAAEKDVLVGKGWKFEGVSWHSAAENKLPVYRVYNPNAKGAGAHHYTLSAGERDSLVSRGWQAEGIGWYAEGQGRPASEYALLNAPFIDQMEAGMPMGCEAASLLEAMKTKGYAQNYQLSQFIKEMPLAANGNPNDGFAGRPDTIMPGTYQSIFPKPLAQWGSKYGKTADLTGTSTEGLKNQLRKGNPVVIFVTLDFQSPTFGNYFWGTGINNAHVMTLDGFNNKDNTYHVSDPYRGQYWVEGAKFEASYNLKKFAVAVQ